MRIASLLDSFYHIFMPKMCCACDKALFANEETLCLDCLFHLPLTDFHTDPNNESARQFWGKLEFEHVCSMLYLSKSSRVEKLLHRLKFQGFPEIGFFLGEKYAINLLSIVEESNIDYIIPIPIHSSKLRKRGYNQAECFAQGLSKGLNIPVLTDILIRSVSSESQTTKARVERYDNVQSVFSVNPAQDNIKNKHILLVDDVLTTGATLCSAGSMLLASGAKISIATIARA